MLSSPPAPSPWQLFNLIPRYFVNVPSRPLWYTVDQTPVLILGGIPEEKSVLLTDTSFTDFFLVEVRGARRAVGWGLWKGAGPQPLRWVAALGFGGGSPKTLPSPLEADSVKEGHRTLQPGNLGSNPGSAPS